MITTVKPASKLTKWFCYTVVIGFMPVTLRLIASLLIDNIQIISPSDFIALGFVLHISIFNELEHMSGDETWKSITNTISIIVVSVYAALMFALLIIESGYDKIKIEHLTRVSVTLSICSLIFCFIIFYRLTVKAKSEDRNLEVIGDIPC